MELATGGGEPFINPDWEDVFRHTVECGMNLIITTNGLLLNPSVTETLTEIEPLEIRVSFDGGPTLHEHIRGSGTYPKTLNGIALLVKAGLNTTARLTLCKGSDSDFQILFQDLSWVGVPLLVPQPILYKFPNYSCW